MSRVVARAPTMYNHTAWGPRRLDCLLLTLVQTVTLFILDVFLDISVSVLWVYWNIRNRLNKFARSALKLLQEHTRDCSYIPYVKYQGLWYEMGKWQNGKWLYGKCKQVEYKLDGEVVKVKNTQVGNGIPTSIEGVATYAPDAGKSANFVITFTFGDAVRANPLLVLQTDYTSYSIGYNCKYDEKKKTHQITAWVLSRSQALPGDARATVEAFLKSKTKEVDASKLLTDISETCKFNGTALITEPVKQ